VGKPVILTPWIPPLDEPEPGGYPQKNNSVYRMKRNVSPVNGKAISVVIAPGKINATITNGINPSITPRPNKAKPKRKKYPQTTRPSKIVSFATSNCLEMKSSKW